MTREEVDKIASDYLNDCESELDMLEVFVVAKESLEQEPILDKIRAEIEQIRLHKAQFLTNDNKVCIDSQEVLDVIDKYKAESEDKE